MSVRELTYRAALGEALREALERDERVLLMGQDIGARGGAFGVTAGLLEAFGPARVRDAPSSEAALVGIGIGAALAGLRPVVELTTATYATLAFDQLIHHAAPLRALSGGRLSAPLTIRMPQGGGARLGPIHSQTLEALLHHVPGLVVATPATPADAKGLLAAAIASEDPVVVLEHAALYDTPGTIEEVDVAPLGHAVVRRAGTDITLVAFSRMAQLIEVAAARLADEHGVAVETIDLRTVRPLDYATVAGSASRTGHVVFVEEGWPAGGVGATLAAQIATTALNARIARVTGADLPAPYARTLERLTIPDERGIAEVALHLLGRGPSADAASSLLGPHPSADAAPRQLDPRASAHASDHTMSTEIDMEALLAARRAGTPLADAVAIAIGPLVNDAAIVLPDGTVTLIGHSKRNPTATLTFGQASTRTTVDAGAVTVHRTASLILRTSATPGEAGTLLAALRERLEGKRST